MDQIARDHEAIEIEKIMAPLRADHWTFIRWQLLIAAAPVVFVVLLLYANAVAGH